MARKSFGRRRGRRAPLRKFVWARSTGSVGFGGTTPGQLPVSDLLEQFQAEYGAQLLGSTVVRIRGIMYPRFPGLVAGTQRGGVAAVIVENDDMDVITGATSDLFTPQERPHDDWLAWMPFFTVGPTDTEDTATSFNGGSEYNVDIKSSRKIEELGQGLHLYVGGLDNLGGDPAQEIDLWYSLSVGLKLP